MIKYLYVAVIVNIWYWYIKNILLKITYIGDSANENVDVQYNNNKDKYIGYNTIFESK